MYYLSAASTISHQPTFRNEGVFASLPVLDLLSTIQNPDYKEFVEAGMLRRMSKILRMSVACAKDSLLQAGVEQPDAIIVGTGLGCLLDTEKFLNNVLTVEGLLPPTSFIQSTHNTLAGQISLSLGNHAYNMTHTQNAVSFEMALQDAGIFLDEGANHVLAGAGDEFIDIETAIAKELHWPAFPLTSGTSFFVLSRERSAQSRAVLVDVKTVGFSSDIEDELTAFLQHNQRTVADLDVVMIAALDGGSRGIVADWAKNKMLIDYALYSGIYPTISAFAFHWAIEMAGSSHPGSSRSILICNMLNKSNIGLTLIEAVEA